MLVWVVVLETGREVLANKTPLTTSPQFSQTSSPGWSADLQFGQIVGVTVATGAECTDAAVG
ncbi:hypothetical protein KSD_26710 [Ktedonobacter sp. SOSP1-85]|nr:hypothetical protein KSD_26710 [Ktedonobacter sp. SOSP1-85]